MAQTPEAELVRFSRFLLAPEVSEEALQKLREARATIVGLGGLGCPVALYLAAAGLGELQLVDADTVDVSNLPRQILFGPENCGQNKAQAAAARLEALHPLTQLKSIVQAVTPENAQQILANTDLVIDCTDRFASRHILNEACHALKLPLVIGSALQWSGQLLIVDPRTDQGGSASAGCYACLFPQDAGEPVVDAACGAYGVVSTAVGLIGLMQANEALKLLMGIPATTGQLWQLEARSLTLEHVRFRRRDNCLVCGGLGKE